MPGTKITVKDMEVDDDIQTKTIVNDYLLITDGTCEMVNVQAYMNKDGSPKTHVLTIKYNQEER